MTTLHIDLEILQTQAMTIADEIIAPTLVLREESKMLAKVSHVAYEPMLELAMGWIMNASEKNVGQSAAYEILLSCVRKNPASDDLDLREQWRASLKKQWVSRKNLDENFEHKRAKTTSEPDKKFREQYRKYKEDIDLLEQDTIQAMVKDWLASIEKNILPAAHQKHASLSRVTAKLTSAPLPIKTKATP